MIKTKEHSVVMCGYFGCDKPASMKVIRANSNVCDEHYISNVLKFGCEFEVEILETVKND